MFDEPTIGLHPHDIQRMNRLLEQLRDKGNTVLVVEHKPETIAIADHVVDLGPGPAAPGGEICFEGTVEGLRASGTLTGRHLDDRAALKPEVRERTGAIEVRGRHDQQPPERRRRRSAGRAHRRHGCGRIREELADPRLGGQARRGRLDRSDSDQGIAAQQSGDIHRTAGADPQGLREGERREAGAVQRELRGGACPTCKGAGVIVTELGFMDTVESPCEDCGGKRFQAAVLDYKLAGKDITEVLDMPVAEAHEFFRGGERRRSPAAVTILSRLEDVGLGYLSLGQPLSTLSGGERQRIKLATQMGDGADVYVLDEPTTGLHLADVANLLALLDRLVDSGKSVIVIEHHQAVMAHADWIIDVGPGAGHDGGRIVYKGTPADLVAAKSTVTGGEHLAAYVGA